MARNPENTNLSRRQFIAFSALAAAGLGGAFGPQRWISPTGAAGGGLAGRFTPAEGERPNVLMIAIDDLNDWVGHLGGHPNAYTPNIDRLAASGVSFANAFCSAPACNPSRVSLFTGIHPSSSGVYTNLQRRSNSPIADAQTLPEAFHEAGYISLGTGKLTHYFEPDIWDEYWPSKTKVRPPNPEPPPQDLPLGGVSGIRGFDWGPLNEEPEEMGDWKCAQWASDLLEAGAFDKPFFLGVGFTKPHIPWYVPRRYFDMHPLESVVLPEVQEGDLDDVPALAQRWVYDDVQEKLVAQNKWREAVRAYLACSTFVDECVGLLLDALEASPYRENTIVVLWSDHGFHLGEKLHWSKFALWEEATHNILVFAGPGIPQGAPCHRVVTLLDIYPTLVELCAVEPRGTLEGKSLVPLLQDATLPWNDPGLTTHGRNNHTLRTERWRYIRYQDGSEELYDREADPLEWENLAQYPEYAPITSSFYAKLPAENAPDSLTDPNAADPKHSWGGPAEIQMIRTALRQPEVIPNLVSFDLLIENTGRTPRDVLRARYERAENRIYLYDPHEDVWSEGIEPGAPQILDNGYLSIDMEKTRVVTFANWLAIDWAFIVSPLLSGTRLNLKVSYAWANGRVLPWDWVGDWVVNRGPEDLIAPEQEEALADRPLFFDAQYGDPDGQADLAEVYLWIGDGPPAVAKSDAGLMLKYDCSGDRLYLRRPEGWQGGFRPGSNAIAGNGIAQLLGSQSEAVALDDTILAMRWAVILSEDFVGEHALYMRAVDRWGGDTEWQQKRTLTIQSAYRHRLLCPRLQS